MSNYPLLKRIKKRGGQQQYSDMAAELCDAAIQTIAGIAAAEWKKRKQYHQRSKSETAMFRYRTILGNTLSATKIKNQQTEVKIGCKILNIALQTTKPASIKIA